MAGGTEQARSAPRRIKSSAAFRTISEVSEELDVAQHVLRFWETKFPHVRPMKRGGGRRYYRPEDIELLRRIRDLLYTEGYTIRGVQKLLREGRGRLPDPVTLRAAAVESAGTGSDPREAIRTAIDQLKTLRDMLKDD